MPPDSFVCPNVSRIGSCAQINSIVAQRQRPILWTLFYHWIVDISLCIGWMFPITMTGLILVCFKSWIIANSEHGILALYSHVCPYVRMCSSVTVLFLFFQTLSSRNLFHSTQYTEHWTMDMVDMDMVDMDMSFFQRIIALTSHVCLCVCLCSSVTFLFFFRL